MAAMRMNSSSDRGRRLANNMQDFGALCALIEGASNRDAALSSGRTGLASLAKALLALDNLVEGLVDVHRCV
jgi:hypothetical protein